jgi:fucose permease
VSPYRRGRAVLLGVAFLSFVSLGLPDGVLGVAWPSIRATFGVPVGHLGVLLIAAMLGYLVSSFCAGWLVLSLGVGPVLAWSSVLMVVNSWGYALASTWPVMAVCAVVAGLGAGAIDAGINAFAASRFSPGTVSWLHASYGVGAMLGPLLMTATLTSGLGWRWGYGLLGLALAAMAAVFALTLDLWKVPPAGKLSEPQSQSLVATLAHPPVWPGVLLFFAYTGLEVTAGQWTYTLLTEARGVAPAMAGAAVAAYWASLTVGRLIAGAIAPRVPARTLISGALGLAPIGGVIIWLAEGGALGVLTGVVTLGIAMAPIYPLLTADTPGRVGAQYATHAISFQVSAAYLGAAVIPSIVGVVATSHGLEIIGVSLVVAAIALIGLYKVAMLIDVRRRIAPDGIGSSIGVRIG